MINFYDWIRDGQPLVPYNTCFINDNNSEKYFLINNNPLILYEKELDALWHYDTGWSILCSDDDIIVGKETTLQYILYNKKLTFIPEK